MSFFQSFTKVVTDTGAAIGSAASQASQAVVETAVGTGEAVGIAVSQAGQAVVETATGVSGAIGNAAAQASQTVVETAVGTGEAVGIAASQAGQAAVETATGVSGAIGSAAAQASQTVVKTTVGAGEAIGSVASQAGQVIAETAPVVGRTIGAAAVQATPVVGHAIAYVGSNPQLQQTTQALKVDWLLKWTDYIDQVDLVEAETEVRGLQQQYPNEPSRDTAHRLMVDKALQAGGSGLASSLVPGGAAVLFAADLAFVMPLQAKMVYQIACAYGRDLQDPATKGEVLAVFGLSFGAGQALIKVGGSFALKALLQNVPVAGAVIGASTNAAMVYALGYGACRFYEAKLNSLTCQATLAASQVESEKYLQAAVAQEAIMDQILVHVVLAGHPGKTWEEILPELQTLNLSPDSLEAIAAHVESPSSLETLLDQLSRDFAIPLLAQCHKVAQLDGATTPEEAKVIDTISQKFGISLDLKESPHQLVMA